MLRRKPTAITLTTEDIAIYEDARATEALQSQQAAHQAHLQAQAEAQAQAQRQGTPGKNQNVRDPSDELRPLPGERVRSGQVKTRDERLGLAGGSSRG